MQLLPGNKKKEKFKKGFWILKSGNNTEEVLCKLFTKEVIRHQSATEALTEPTEQWHNSKMQEKRKGRKEGLLKNMIVLSYFLPLLCFLQCAFFKKKLRSEIAECRSGFIKAPRFVCMLNRESFF